MSEKITLTAGRKACRILQCGKKITVIGVFSKAVYAECDGEILLLHDRKWGIVPFGVAVSSVEELIKNAKIAVGGEISLADGIFSVGSVSFSAELSEECEKAISFPEPPKKMRIDELYAYISERGSEYGLFDYIRQNRGGVNDSLSLLCDGDISGVKRLVGLGRGLTPSGDDFLCGFVSLLRCANHPYGEAVCREISKNLDRTSTISSAYLLSVCEGEQFTVYKKAVLALLDGDFKENADFVLEMGASSGTDTLFGVIYAARLLTAEK